MRDLEAPQELIAIFQDIAERERQKREKETEIIGHGNTRNRVINRFMNLLRCYGSIETASMDLGSGTKRTFARKETPYIEMGMNGEKVNLKVADGAYEGSNREIYIEGYLLLAKRHGSDETLFHIRHANAINWNNEKATTEQMISVEQILFSMDAGWGFKKAPQQNQPVSPATNPGTVRGLFAGSAPDRLGRDTDRYATD